MNIEEFKIWIDSSEYKNKLKENLKAKEEAEDKYYFLLGEEIENSSRYLKLKAFW